MGYIQGEGRDQGTLFPVVLDDFVTADHVCRAIDAFVEKLMMSKLGFERTQAAETGRPGYDPRDLLKLFLYGYSRSAVRDGTGYRRAYLPGLIGAGACLRSGGEPLVMGQQEARQEGVTSVDVRDICESEFFDEAILKRAVHAFDAALGLA